MFPILRVSLLLVVLLQVAGSAPVHGAVRDAELVGRVAQLLVGQADGIPIVGIGPISPTNGSGEGTGRVFVPGRGLLNPDGTLAAPAAPSTPEAAAARTTVSSGLREQLLSQMEQRETKDSKLGVFVPAHLAATQIAEAGADLRDRDAVIRISQFLNTAMSAIESRDFDKTKAQVAVDQFLQEVKSFRTFATAGAFRLANEWLSARTFGLIQLQGAEPGGQPQPPLPPEKQALLDQVRGELSLLGQEAAEAKAQATTPNAVPQSAVPAAKSSVSPQANLERATKAYQDAQKEAYNAQLEEAKKARAAAEKASADYAASIRRLNEANRKASQIQRGIQP